MESDLMNRTMTYVVARSHRGLNIPTSLQVSSIRNHLNKIKRPFSLPITEWYNPPVYSRLFENIESGEYSEICVYSLKMLPEFNSNHHKIFVTLAKKNNIILHSVLENLEIKIEHYEKFILVNYIYPQLRYGYSSIQRKFYSFIND